MGRGGGGAAGRGAGGGVGGLVAGLNAGWHAFGRLGVRSRVGLGAKAISAYDHDLVRPCECTDPYRSCSRARRVPSDVGGDRQCGIRSADGVRGIRPQLCRAERRRQFEQKISALDYGGGSRQRAVDYTMNPASHGVQLRPTLSAAPRFDLAFAIAILGWPMSPAALGRAARHLRRISSRAARNRRPTIRHLGPYQSRGILGKNPMGAIDESFETA